MNKKIIIFLFLSICLIAPLLAQEDSSVPKHNKSFLGLNYQLEFGEYLAKPIKFYGFLWEYDFKPWYKIGFKLAINKEDSWMGDGWELMLVPRKYFSFTDSEDALIGSVGIGVLYKTPSRIYSSYDVASEEYIYVKDEQLLGKWKSVVVEFGLRGKSFGRVYFETSLVFKPLNFYVKNKTEINGFVAANLTILYCVRK
jgi:hypothetical protein